MHVLIYSWDNGIILFAYMVIDNRKRSWASTQMIGSTICLAWRGPGFKTLILTQPSPQKNFTPVDSIGKLPIDLIHKADISLKFLF